MRIATDYNDYVRPPLVPDVVTMNRRLAAPDNSLNAPVRAEGEGEWQDWLVDDSPTQETRLAETEELSARQRLLGKALDGLNERQRMAVVLNKFEDMGYAEIAEVMGLSTKAIKSLLSRARTNLRQALAGYIYMDGEPIPEDTAED